MSLLASGKFDVTTLPFLALGQYAALPNVAGVYFVTTADHEILYIGSAKSLCFRWRHHERLQEFSTHDDVRIGWIAMNDIDVMREAEKRFISLFQPRYNKPPRTVAPVTRQTPVRLSPELLRMAKFLLDEEDSNLQKFLSEQLERYVERRTQEKRHREAVPAS